MSDADAAGVERALANSLIIIPSIEGAPLLERMLPSLNVPRHIILVLDQGSADATASVCANAGIDVLQIGSPRTYTECCNIGLEIARRRGAEYLFISNNDIRLTTDVTRELLKEMLADEKLAIVAPSQVMIFKAKDERHVAYRVKWSLDKDEFDHDFNCPTGNSSRIESDFCELTFALVRVDVVTRVGGLDDDFGFYHEDADLCFRLRQAGFSCAYAPASQIEHYPSSTFSGPLLSAKESYLKKSKELFALKHLGYGVNYHDHRSGGHTSWQVTNKNLHRYLGRHGLLNNLRPILNLDHPRHPGRQYLYTVWETSVLPAGWNSGARDYLATFVPSRWNEAVFRKAGFERLFYAPLGVETDVFCAGGPSQRSYEEKTFLWFASNQFRKGLDVMLGAWEAFRPRYPIARLIIMGTGIFKGVGIDPGLARQWDHCLVFDDHERRISYREVVTPLSELDIAMLYRGVDVVVNTSRSEGFGFCIAEAMSCGAEVVFPRYGGSADMVFTGALTFDGSVASADYSDKGFENVGEWWEPNIAGIVAAMSEAMTASDSSRAKRARAAAIHTRSGLTWRNTVFAFRAALVQLQEQAEVESPAQTRIAHAERAEMRRFARSLGEKVGDPIPSAHPQPDQDLAKNFPEIDWHWYLNANPDLIAAGVEPVGHFIRLGWQENRRVSPNLNTRQYIEANSAARAYLLGSLPDSSAPRAATNAATAPDEDHDKSWRSDLLCLVDRFTRDKKKLQATGASKVGALDRDVLFLGYVEAGLGIGESLRGLISAIDAPDEGFGIYPFNVNVEERFQKPFLPARYDMSRFRNINIIEVACDQVPVVVESVGEEKFRRGYNVLRSAAELPSFSADMRHHLRFFHEIWTPSKFCEAAFRSIFDGEIHLFPHRVDVSSTVASSRDQFGLDSSKFYFMFSFDYHSTPTRKNPLGVIEAFQMAFPKGNDGVGLIIKSVGVSGTAPRTRRLVHDRVLKDSRLIVIDRPLGRDEMIALMGLADCYVSLHRSEGFGLGMAEAMALGKPVIATNYSGNTDFLSAETGFPVDYRLRELRDGEYGGWLGQSWAEPDLGSARDQMLAVYHDERERRRRADAGRVSIEARYGKSAVANAFRNRAAAIRAKLAYAKLGGGGSA